MPISTLLNTNDFDDWKTLFNQVVAQINTMGAVASLSTTDKTSLVNAINELVAKMGSLASLSTTNKTSLVNAINELAVSVNGLVIGTSVQAFSPLLTSLAGLSTLVADRIAYTTGTFSAATITTTGRNVIAAANAGAIRTILQLGPLSTITAFSADTIIAAITADTPIEISCTALGRALIASTSTQSAINTLGLTQTVNSKKLYFAERFI
jgi:hypothetical protein